MTNLNLMMIGYYF